MIAIGFVLGNLMFPKIIKEIEIREVEVIKERIKRVVHIIERPDGTKETIIKEETEKETTVAKESIEKTRPARMDWIVGVGKDMIGGEDYIYTVDRRIIGNLYLGAYGNTNSSYGLRAVMTF